MKSNSLPPLGMFSISFSMLNVIFCSEAVDIELPFLPGEVELVRRLETPRDALILHSGTLHDLSDAQFPVGRLVDGLNDSILLRLALLQNEVRELGLTRVEHLRYRLVLVIELVGEVLRRVVPYVVRLGDFERDAECAVLLIRLDLHPDILSSVEVDRAVQV